MSGRANSSRNRTAAPAPSGGPKSSFFGMPLFPERWFDVVDKESIKRIIRREILRYHALKKASEVYPDLKEYFEEVDKEASSGWNPESVSSSD